MRYAIVIEKSESNYSAYVPDLPGCMSDGDTPEEAVANVLDAIDSWLEAANDAGRAIPEPSRVAAIA